MYGTGVHGQGSPVYSPGYSTQPLPAATLHVTDLLVHHAATTREAQDPQRGWVAGQGAGLGVKTVTV